jgi:enoyl-CoA hydratase/carnithine racemase
MPEINWGITPGWGGTGRLSKFAGRRKTKEWNLLGGLFSAATAERHNLVNRLCEPEDLDREIEMLSEVLLSKDRHATTVTKYFVDKAADLDMWSSMFFEGNPARFGPGENATAGIQAFTQKSTRDERRELIKNFWQD